MAADQDHDDSNMPHPETDLVALVNSWSPSERREREKNFVSKIDLRFLPILVSTDEAHDLPIFKMTNTNILKSWVYVLNHIDRNAVPHARVQDLEAGLGLTGYQYNIVLSVTFVGYISMQVPSKMILSLVRPSLYLSLCMVAWSIVSTPSGMVQDFGGLKACRFILGITEAPFFVGVNFSFSGWYTRKEMGLRFSIFFSAAMLSGSFEGLSATGIAAAFLTVLFTAITPFIIPDWPATIKWLSTDERAIAVVRLLEDAGEEEEDITTGVAFKIAVTDYRVWLCIVGQVCVQAVASLSNFMPTLVQDFGYERIETLLLTAPPYILAAIACIVNSSASDRMALRAYFIIGPWLVTATGIILTMATTHTAARYFAVFLMLPGAFCCFQVSNAWMSNIAARPRKKRAIARAMNTAFGNSAMTWTPYLYPESEGPRYTKAWSVNLSLILVCTAATFTLHFCLSRCNNKITKVDAVQEAIKGGELKVCSVNESEEISRARDLDIRHTAKYQL